MKNFYKKGKFNYIAFIIVLCFVMVFFYRHQKLKTLPLIAIVNYGPHASLEATIAGFKKYMHAEGFIENQTVRYTMADVGFDPSLLPQTLVSMQTKKPSILLTLTTPVAQMAKMKSKNIPLIYAAITDPVEAGLIKNPTQSEANITGSSDKQDIDALLKFVCTILPKAKRIGVLYATSEANDTALVRMLKKGALAQGMSVMAIPVEQARDVYLRMQMFKNKVDCIYVGTSGPIQPTLPTISAQAFKMGIPVLNAEAQAVKEGMALASFGVHYLDVGKNAGKLAAAILRGKKVKDLTPIYPKITDHRGIVHKSLAEKYGAHVPENVEVVEQ